MATANVQVGQVAPLEPERPPVLDDIDKDGGGAISEDAAKNEPASATDSAAPAEAPLYSVFTGRQKRMTVYTVSVLAMISPLSGTSYFPALTSLAADFNVSVSLIQLSITTYQVSAQHRLPEIDS